MLVLGTNIKMNFFLRIKLRIFLFGALTAISVTILTLFVEVFRFLRFGKNSFTHQHNVALSISARLLQDLELPSKEVEFDLPIIVDWHGTFSTRGNKSCNNHHCYFTRDRRIVKHPLTRAILFKGERFSLKDLPLPRELTHNWGLFFDQDFSINPLFCHPSVMQYFNHTATISQQADVPMTLHHLDSPAYIKDSKNVISLTEKNTIVKTKNLALIGYFEWDCDTATERDRFVEDLQKIIKVDSHGGCINNQDEILVEKSSDHIRIMSQYKFVLVLERGVNHDSIGPRLWQAFHVGSVPIYYGAPNIDKYLPNKNSVIKVTDFANLANLVDHINAIDADERSYVKYMSHKLMYNNDYFSLVSNGEIENYYPFDKYQALFECLVCERESKNYRVTKVGFSGFPHHTEGDLHSCFEPKSILEMFNQKDTGVTNKWKRKWQMAQNESEFLNHYHLKKKVSDGIQ